MRNYFKSEAEMEINDKRSSFLSSPEADKQRKENLAFYADLKPEIRAEKKMEKNQSRAMELIPETVFNPEYQAEILKIYHLITNLLKSKLKTQEHHEANNGWKKIYAGNLANQQQILNLFFQEPFFSEKPTVRSFVKKIPNKDSFSKDTKERIFNLISTGELAPQKEKVVLVNQDILSETVFFIDSRFLPDLVDMFHEEGKKAYDHQSGTFLGYEHPLLHHTKLQNLSQKIMIPISLLEFGKPEVITPDKMEILQRTFLEIDHFLEEENRLIN